MMNYINKFFDYFGFDGCKHIVLSAIIVAVLALVFPNWMAFVIGLIIGLVKEFVYDKFLGKGTFEKKDMIADLIGCVIGFI